MKIMKNILVLLCVTLLVMTATCFAMEADQAMDFLLKADNTKISAGDSVNITIYADGVTTTESVIFGSYYIYFDSTKFDSEGSVETYEVEGYNAKVGALIETETSVDYSNIATYTFTAKSDLSIGEYTMWLQEVTFMDADGNMNDTTNEDLCTDEITITVESGEEVFTPTYEGFVEEEGGEVKTGFAAGSKVATVFAKAETALTAGTYGIVFGGQKYVGAADVAEGKYWVIRLYDPSGSVLDFSKDYACQTFVGESFSDADYQTASKN